MSEEKEKCFIKLIKQIRFSQKCKQYMEDSENSQCPYCEQHYKDKYIMNTHIRRIHNKYPYLCLKCFKSYRKKCMLKMHIELEHLNLTKNKRKQLQEQFKLQEEKDNQELYCNNNQIEENVKQNIENYQIKNKKQHCDFIQEVKEYNFKRFMPDPCKYRKKQHTVIDISNINQYCQNNVYWKKQNECKQEFVVKLEMFETQHEK